MTNVLKFKANLGTDTNYPLGRSSGGSAHVGLSITSAYGYYSDDVNGELRDDDGYGGRGSRRSNTLQLVSIGLGVAGSVADAGAIATIYNPPVSMGFKAAGTIFSIGSASISGYDWYYSQGSRGAFGLNVGTIAAGVFFRGPIATTVTRSINNFTTAYDSASYISLSMSPPKSVNSYSLGGGAR